MLTLQVRRTGACDHSETPFVFYMYSITSIVSYYSGDWALLCPGYEVDANRVQ